MNRTKNTYDTKNVRVADNAKELKAQSAVLLRRAFDASQKNGTVKRIVVKAR